MRRAPAAAGTSAPAAAAAAAARPPPPPPPPPPPLHTLSSGPWAGLCLRPASTTAGELEFLYRECVVDDTYLSAGGLELRHEEVVVDVGANAGITALHCAQRVGEGGLVVALEPLPASFAALEHNVRAHREWCAASGRPPPAHVEAVAAGAGSVAGEAQFTFYPAAAGWGTLSALEQPAEVVAADMRAFLAAALDAAGGGGGGVVTPLQATALRALRRASPAAFAAAVGWATRRMMAGRQRHTCQVTTVSAVLAERLDISRPVGLVKVDVERAELAVLEGVTPGDWPRVRQVAVEAHDEALAGCVRLLRGRAGFGNRVRVEQPPALRGTSLRMVYCRRE